MSASVIPKEKLSAYQRWEMASFDAPVKPESPVAVVEAAPVQLPTAAEVEALQARAWQEGYDAGKAEAQVQARRLVQLGNAFHTAVAHMESELADDLLTLAIDIARQMLRHTLTQHPEKAMPVIREAMEQMQHVRQIKRLHVHPDDAALVSQHLGAQLAPDAWQLVADPTIARNGCRIESSVGDLEASLSQRWKDILATLGRDDAWLD